jgi:hypothetical protein
MLKRTDIFLIKNLAPQRLSRIFNQIKKYKHMKKFIVKETRPAMATWTYEVEAKSEDEAVAKVFDELDVKKVDLAYDVDFEADMGVEVDEETQTSDEAVTMVSFTRQQLIEYTSLIQERCKHVAIEAIKDYGIEGDEYIELELDYNNIIQTNFDDGAFIKEIESIIEEAFGTDDDSVFDEATNVIQFMKKV